MNKGLATHYRHIKPEDMLHDGTIHYNVWIPKDIEHLLKKVGFTINSSFSVTRPEGQFFGHCRKKSLNLIFLDNPFQSFHESKCNHSSFK